MKNKLKIKIVYYGLFILEIAILAALILSFFNNSAFGSSAGNVSVITGVNISATYPEILNVEINSGSPISLTPNSTKAVICEGLVKDYNDETILANATGVIYNSTYSSLDDNNDHYTNSSCTITPSYSGSYKGFSDDQYTALINCTFNMQYYSNPGGWNCTLFVNNTYGLNNTNSSNGTVSTLLAVGVPNTISYGTVNTTSVSSENITNVTNAGNVIINLTLKGYSVNVGDPYAMNCSLGATKNISIGYEKYNLTDTNPQNPITLSTFESEYLNLTANSAVKTFNLNSRTDDFSDNAINSTYWRVYIPAGVAGTCSGNIVFGATQAAGS